MYGRKLLTSEISDSDLFEQANQIPAIIHKGNDQYCNRCGTIISPEKNYLPGNEFYCGRCLNLGRVSTLQSFWHVEEPNKFDKVKSPLTWDGKLSKLQAECSERVKQSMLKREKHLLWAVTGAGKTEMLFEAIAAALARGERIALASPRVDVCLELFPRLQKAFQKHQICLLHGRMKEPYTYQQFTICTTHQLLRFYHAFDNLIIDEVDAFPFAANKALYYASNHAIKTDGGLLYLTATPSKELLDQVRKKKMAITYLPLRFHGHLLPTIKTQISFDWRKGLNKGRLPESLLRAMRLRMKNNIRFLLFVPHVADLPKIEKILVKKFPNQRVVTVHAADSLRLEKVQLMRNNEIFFLVTTSILERGVTFPKIDVFVLGADDAVFSSAALVQIAGRAGRSNDRPTGDVIFWINSLNKSVIDAIRQINFVNRKGKKLQ